MPLNVKSRYYLRREGKQIQSRLHIDKHNTNLPHSLASFRFLLSWGAARSMASEKEGERDLVSQHPSHCLEYENHKNLETAGLIGGTINRETNIVAFDEGRTQA